MHDAKLAGVPTPTIYFVDLTATTIIMEYIDGKRVKDVLNEMSLHERKKLCETLGYFVGRLHRKRIIHGDLTTSNIIIDKKGKIFFIDFGLAEYSEEVEKRGVDLLLIKRALQSAHYNYARDCFNAIIEGYSLEMGKDQTVQVANRVDEIEKRGRYAIER
jgi:TP53 regulating kinase-like protein